jgi:hypothetical protein
MMFGYFALMLTCIWVQFVGDSGGMSRRQADVCFRGGGLIFYSE